MGLFDDVITPAVPVLALMESRGLPLDVAMRDRLRDEAHETLEDLRADLTRETGDFHARWTDTLRGFLADVEASIATFPRGKAPEALKRSKATIRARLKSAGEAFSETNDNHWRILLFNKEVGLGLKHAGATKAGLPSVDKDAIETLAKRHPEVRVLGLRQSIQDVAVRLRNRLAVEPDSRGRVHFGFAFHRTSTGRLASGGDDTDVDKERESDGGNAQNVADRDRRMFRAEAGRVLVEGDWSQIEARVQAWLARDEELIRAYRDGIDVHAEAAAALYEIPVSEVRKRTVRFRGQDRSVRDAGKGFRHMRNYGAGDRKIAVECGIPVALAETLAKRDDARWPRMAAFRLEEVERGIAAGRLTNPFGRVMDFPRTKGPKGWTIDREAALAFRPQSTVGDMCKAVLAALEEVSETIGAEFLLTVHDSFLFQVERAKVEALVAGTRRVLERAWPEMGEIEGFGFFSCPADFKVGLNWGKQKEDNVDGLEDFA